MEKRKTVIALLAYPNVLRSTFFGISEFFELSKRQAGTEWIQFEVIASNPEYVPANGAVRSLHEIDAENLDCVIVPPCMGAPGYEKSSPEINHWLCQMSEQGVLITSACAGAFVLAHSGILNGKKATTHWDLQGEFQRRFPDVILETDRLMCLQGNIITAGGLTSWIDLCIYLTARFAGVKLAHKMGRFFLVDTGGREQRFYCGFSPNYRHGDDRILAAQKWMEEHSSLSFDLEQLAAHLHVSGRTLQRRFKRATDLTPIQYLQQLRIQNAKEMLEESIESVEEIVWKTGYEDVVTFGKLFKRITGLSPAAYRKRFRMAHV